MRERLGLVRSGNAPKKRATDFEGAKEVAFDSRAGALADEDFFGKRPEPTPRTDRRAVRRGSDASSSDGSDEEARVNAKGASSRRGGDGSVNDSAGSDEGVAGRGGEEKPKTRAQKMMDAMRRVKDRAKAGIVNVPKGSATRAKHGMAKSVKDLRKEKEEKEEEA